MSAVHLDVDTELARRRDTADGFSRLLADTFALFLKTHGYHWNVTGPMFPALHAMFEVHYGELALAVDEIAERIRALGERAPGTYREFIALGSIEEDADVPVATEMIRRLAHGHRAVAEIARSVARLAEHGDDLPSIDLCGRRIAAHERAVWMLESLLD